MSIATTKRDGEGGSGSVQRENKSPGGPASAQAAELTPAPAGDGADEQEEEEEEDEEDEEAGEEAAGAAAAEHPALGPAVDADGNPLVAPPNPYNLGACLCVLRLTCDSRALCRHDQGVDVPGARHLRQEGDARS